MPTYPTNPSLPSFARTHAPKLLAGLAVLAVLLVLATWLTALDASTASGLFVGVIVGGSAAVLGAQRKARTAQAHHRQADDETLDELEPLRPERPS